MDLKVQQALGRDDTWDWKNVCPPCFYVLKNEMPLKPSWLGSIDGNNSLKLVDSTFRAGNPRFDNRKSTSFRWLTPQQVDKYMDEVKNAPKVRLRKKFQQSKSYNILGSNANSCLHGGYI